MGASSSRKKRLLKCFSFGKEKGIAVEGNELIWDEEIKGQNHEIDGKKMLQQIVQVARWKSLHLPAAGEK